MSHVLESFLKWVELCVHFIVAYTPHMQDAELGKHHMQHSNTRLVRVSQVWGRWWKSCNDNHSKSCRLPSNYYSPDKQKENLCEKNSPQTCIVNTISDGFNPIESNRREVYIIVDFWTAKAHIPTCVALEQRTGEGAAYGTRLGPDIFGSNRKNPLFFQWSFELIWMGHTCTLVTLHDEYYKWCFQQVGNINIEWEEIFAMFNSTSCQLA